MVCFHPGLRNVEDLMTPASMDALSLWISESISVFAQFLLTFCHVFASCSRILGDAFVTTPHGDDYRQPFEGGSNAFSVVEALKLRELFVEKELPVACRPVPMLLDQYISHTFLV